MKEPDTRISQIQTRWSLVARAHGSDEDLQHARAELLDCYAAAVQRYLIGALRSEDAANEVFQEFSLRVIRGDFRGAEPDQGRFRSYLKTCLHHLMMDYHRQIQRKPRSFVDNPSAIIAPPITNRYQSGPILCRFLATGIIGRNLAPSPFAEPTQRKSLLCGAPCASGSSRRDTQAISDASSNRGHRFRSRHKASRDVAPSPQTIRGAIDRSNSRNAHRPHRTSHRRRTDRTRSPTPGSLILTKISKRSHSRPIHLRHPIKPYRHRFG